MESFSPPENLSTSIKEKMKDELIEGREYALQLRNILAESDDDSTPVGDLLMKIVKTFSNALSVLNVKEGHHHHVASMISQIQSDLPCLDAPKSPDRPQESFRRSVTPFIKNNRRRTSTLLTREIVSPIFINDCHTWRKYGQKFIQNTIYPRQYFRCSYKNDQGCKAIKHIQRIQEHPPLYRTTYFGDHTCRNPHQYLELMLDSTSPTDTSTLICFDRTKLINKQQNFPLLSSFSSTKCESKENITCDANHNYVESELPDKYSVSPAFPSPDGSMLGLSPTMDLSDYVDAMYGMMKYDDFYV